MSFSKSASFFALGASLAASGAWAEVSASDVWSDLRSYMTNMGYVVTGTERQSGAVLTVDGVQMTQTIPEENTSVSIDFGKITFSENGDGTVSVGMAGSVPVRVNATPEEGAPFAMRMDITQIVPVLIVSGDPGDMTYTYSATELGLALQELVAEGNTLTPGQVDVSATMTDVSAITRMTQDGGRAYSQQMTAASVRYKADLDIPGPEGVQGVIAGGLEGLALQSSGRLPENANPNNLSAMLAQGAGGTASLSYAAGNSSFDLNSPDGPASGRSTSGATEMGFSFQSDGMVIDAVQNNVDVTMQMATLPLPIEMSIAKSGFNLRMPVTPSDAAQDFALGLSLEEFTISDMIWGMFDPAGQLPRDPITLVMDFSGKALLSVDYFDPEVVASMDENDTVPGQLDSLTINRVFLSALGAMVAGEGSFTFDNSDLQSFGGQPRPEGTLDVTLEGVNALMDTLVNMGLLPQDRAMAGRVMMGLFTVPDGEDRLKSTIEVTREGNVLANGQHLR